LPEKEKKKSIPKCKYNSGVVCPYEHRHCRTCGWNIEVSYKRIKEKYGIKGTIYLSLPDPRKRG